MFLLEKHGMAHFFTTKDKHFYGYFKTLENFFLIFSSNVCKSNKRRYKTVVIKGEDELLINILKWEKKKELE